MNNLSIKVANITINSIQNLKKKIKIMMKISGPSPLNSSLNINNNSSNNCNNN